MYLIPFKAEHAHHMVNHIMNDPHTELDKNWHSHLDGLEVPDMSFTAMDNDSIICSGGIIPIWEGVFEGWVMASNLIWQNKFSSAKIIKKGMNKLIKDYKVIRLQTAVKENFTLGHRFAEWLEMKQEGLMEQYQNNENYYRYARII